MKIQILSAPSAYPAQPGLPVRVVVVKLDERAIANVAVSETQVGDDERIVTLELPDFRAVDNEPPLGIDLAVAEVLRRYVSDVAMRDTLATALIEKLTAEIGDDPPGLDGATFRELEAAAIEKSIELRNQSDQAKPNERRAAREFSLAVTALEDAGIRFTRGLAELKGVRSDVDLEKLDAADERARFTEAVRQATTVRDEPGGEAGDDTGAGGS